MTQQTKDNIIVLVVKYLIPIALLILACADME